MLVQSDPKGMVACINEFRFKNPEQGWVIGILSHAGVSGDLQLIRNVNSVQLGVSFVVGGHSHEAFFENKRGRCLKTEFNATLQQTFCECAPPAHLFFRPHSPLGLASVRMHVAKGRLRPGTYTFGWRVGCRETCVVDEARSISVGRSVGRCNGLHTSPLLC